MQVHSGDANKAQVFEACKAEFTELFAANEAAEAQKQQIAMVIQNCAP